MKQYTCRICGFKAGLELARRHANLVHPEWKEQPRCKVCGDVAEVWATSKHKTAYCNRHSNRYGLCRWCAHPRSIGFGSGISACRCGPMGYLRDEAIRQEVA